MPEIIDTSEVKKILVKDVQRDPKAGKVPHFQRTIHEGTPSFVFTRKQACRTPKEVARSADFGRLARIYARTNKDKLTKRGINQHEALATEQVPDFVALARKIASIEGQDFKPADLGGVENLKIHLAQLQGLLKFWLGYRTRGQFNNLELNAGEEQDSLDGAIRAFAEKVNVIVTAISSSTSLDLPKDMSYAPMQTVIGEYRDSMPTVFRALEEETAFAYPKGLNIKTGIKRRVKGSPKDEYDEGGRVPGERDVINGSNWLEKRYSFGGMRFSVFYSDEYSAHLANGMEALSRDPMLASMSKSIPPIKLYLGVNPKLMNGQDRMVYTRHSELRMAVAARQKNGVDTLDYFGYLKKSVLIMVNMWMATLSTVSSRKYLLKRGKDQEFEKLMEGFPEQYRPLYAELRKLLSDQPEKFQELLPQVKIPEINYRPNDAGFDAGRYLYTPVHGAAYTVKVQGKEQTFVLPGDSGVGKSEVLRELMEMGVEVVNVIADDMLFLITDRHSGRTFIVGTEAGAFTKTDDLKGSANTNEATPVVGYNANEKGGNRRIVEPSVATPRAAHEVDAYLALVNATPPQKGKSRVVKLNLSEFTKLWQRGPYAPSSSIAGGGTGTEREKMFPFGMSLGYHPSSHN